MQPVPEGSDEAARKVLEIFPEARSAVYDMRKIVACLADRDCAREPVLLLCPHLDELPPP